MRADRKSFIWGLTAGAGIVSLLLLGAFAWTFRTGFTAEAQPGLLEKSIAQHFYRATIPGRFRSMSNQMPSAEDNLHQGMEHYADHCASCHANNGSGDTMYGRGLSPRPPDLRSAATQSKSDGELYYVIEHGVRMTGMPAFGQPGVGHDHGSWNLVLFIRHLPSLTPQEEIDMQAMNPVTPSEQRERQEEEEFLNDKKLQGEKNEEPCSGNSAASGEHFDGIRPRRYGSHPRRGVEDQW